MVLWSSTSNMSTLFIADIHLSIQKPTIIAGFLHFLRHYVINAEALYILGDLFEIWIGDDDPNPLHQEIATALKALSQRGIRCYFIHGNRDFLLGQHYAANCGMTLLPAQQVLELAGYRVVILHGDTLCTDDIDYQYFRCCVRQYWFKKLFLLLPLPVRLNIAGMIRANNVRIDTNKKMDAIDVNMQSVMTVLTQTKAAIMIHGHTHQPALHEIASATGVYHRAVLGAWYQHGSVIEVSTLGIALIQFPF